MNTLPILKLDNVGKIYAGDSGASVGIKGVSLSFDSGEFVVVTGESGAGKSTLLNVLGAIDGFEEGEVYFNGRPLSRCTERERDEYRDRNVSFVFQDYNIIESLTVRDNIIIGFHEQVKRNERLTKTNEILQKLGLSRFAARKAGRLSGGQKQRVAIARALASRRQIILADEPIAHLDSETSQVIVSALAEAAKDCLVIVCTHDAQAFAMHATRIVRMHEGNVCENVQYSTQVHIAHKIDCKSTYNDSAAILMYKGGYLKRLWNGASLGSRLMVSKPKTATLLQVLFLFSSVLLFLFSSAFLMQIHKVVVEDGMLFRGGEQRLIVTHRDGSPITAHEVENLARRFEAKDYEHCDILIDSGSIDDWYKYFENPSQFAYSETLDWTPPYQVIKSCNVGTPDIGRYPQTASECMVYVPYALKNYYGYETIKRQYEKLYGVDYRVVGVKYYVENDLQGKILLTQDGYRICALMAYIGNKLYCDCRAVENGTVIFNHKEMRVRYDFNAESDGIVLRSDAIDEADFVAADIDFVLQFYFLKEDNKYKAKTVLPQTYSRDSLLWNDANIVYSENNSVVVNPLFIIDLLHDFAANHLRQCTLLFDNAEDAKKAATDMNKEGYFVATGNDTYAMSEEIVRSGVLIISVAFIGEVAILIILGLVLHMFISRIMQSWCYDVTVMRAVGVGSETVKFAIYYRILVPILLSFALMFGLSAVLYRSPFISRYILWLRPYHYLFLIVGIFLIVGYSVELHRRRYMDISIKEALRGGV